jgi:hypothetical protein
MLIPPPSAESAPNSMREQDRIGRLSTGCNRRVLRGNFQSACDRRNPYVCCSRAAQHSRAFGNGRASGVNVIDQEHLASLHQFRLCYRKGSTQVLATLVAGEPDLRCSFAFTNKGSLAQAKAIRVRTASNGGSRGQFGLIKPALPTLAAVKWNGNQNHLAGRQFGPELRDGLAQQATENIGSGTHSTEFQQVNQFAQAGLVAAVRYGSRKQRFDPAAQSALRRICAPKCVRREDPLATRKADGTLNGMNRLQAFATNWEPRKIRQRPRADTAIGRKQCREKIRGELARENPQGQAIVLPAGFGFIQNRAFNRTAAGLRNDRRPRTCSCGLVSPNSVLTTAEDGLRISLAKFVPAASQI